MTSSLSFAELLVDNLKALNAKERDHLMRFAYLGDPGEYQNTQRWLSQSMTTALHSQLVGTKLEGEKTPPCVFAAMDYHLDWLHAALLSTCADSELQIGLQALCPDSSWTEPSLQPVIGIQEDLDLIVVFANQKGTVIFFIEAKGVDSFNKVQLSRKLIRLDRILLASNAYNDPRIECKFVMVAPKALTFKAGEEADCRKYARANSEVSLMGKYLKDHPAEIGCGFNFVKLEGFPSDLKKVTRTGPADVATRAKYTQWKIVNRTGNKL